MWENMYKCDECKNMKILPDMLYYPAAYKVLKDGNVEWFKNRDCKYNLFNTDFIKVMNDYQTFIENDGKSNYTCAYYLNIRPLN